MAEPVLYSCGLNLNRSKDRAIAEVGGEFMAFNSTDPLAVVAECRRRGVKALEVRHRHIEFLRKLPELEFVSFNVTGPRIAPLHSLGRLRGLAADSWEGDLDFSKFPRLEWFNVVEAEKGQLDSLYAGHPRLHHLAIGKYREADLTPLIRLPSLISLEIYNTRSLQNLKGVDQLPKGLKALELNLCPKLESVAGIAGLENLEYLRLDTCNKISDLSEVAQLPNLRFLNAGGMRSIETLKPLAGHGRLEVLYFGKILDGDLGPLKEIPNLKLIHSGPHRKEIEMLGIPCTADLDWEHPLKAYAWSLAHS